MLTALICTMLRNRSKKSVRQGLLAIADAKTAQLESFVRERRADMNMASRIAVLVDSMSRLSKQRAAQESLDSAGYLELTKPAPSSP